MFIGHFGVAFAAKKVAPQTSLGTLILAAQFLDFLWPLFLLLGIEQVRIAPGITRVSPLDFTDYPISHSLLMATVWAVVFSGVYYAQRRSTPRSPVASRKRGSLWPGLVEFVAGNDCRRSLLLWRRTVDLPRLHTRAGQQRPLRLLGSGGISIFWLGQHAVCRGSAECHCSRLGRHRDVVDRSLGLVGRPAPRRGSFHLIQGGLNAVESLP
jgi:hypothetical protein